MSRSPTPYPLGRRPQPDERNQAHLMRAVMGAPTRPARRMWGTDWVGDQGNASTCVGFAWHGMRRAMPTKRLKPTPLSIYDGAQRLDDWPGTDYEGTSVLAGAKYLDSRGLLTRYLWAYSVDDVLDWVGNWGPVVLGTAWYERMFYPKEVAGVPNTLVTTGEFVGGHAYLCIGYDDGVSSVRIVNSWGRAWGADGRAWLRYGSLGPLIEAQGEACTAIETA